jgi:hypothetical protein
LRLSTFCAVIAVAAPRPAGLAGSSGELRSGRGAWQAH